MRIPVRLRLIFSLAATALLLLLFILVVVVSQWQIDEANRGLQEQQRALDALRRSQVLALRLKDAATAPDQAATIDLWRTELNELQGLIAGRTDGPDTSGFTASQQGFIAALDRVSAATAAANTNSAAQLARDQLSPATSELVAQQDNLLAARLRLLDAYRDRQQTVGFQSQTVRFVGAVVVLLLIMLTGWTALNWAGRPLADLARQIRRKSHPRDGKWSDFHVEAGAPRELSDLADGLNDLVVQLRQQSIEMVSANMKLEALSEEVLSASRAKSAFLSTMSHELRTPLNAVIGFTELLEDEVYGPLNDKQHEQLQRVMRSSQNLLVLINNILDISRLEAGKITLQMSVISPESLVSSVVSVVEPLARHKGLRLTVDIARPLPRFSTDETRLRQVLLNLANNALKFTKTGTIGLGAKIDPRLPNWIVFTVSDTGIGISEEELSRIWDEFYQIQSGLNREAGGSGLGLALVHKLVDVLGGDIEVKSEVGEGTNFSIYMPLAEPGVDYSSSSSSSSASNYAATGSFRPIPKRSIAPLLNPEGTSAPFGNSG